MHPPHLGRLGDEWHFYYLSRNNLTVNATVRDSVTNKTYTESLEVYFRKSIYKISAVDVPESYKRGIPYAAYVCVNCILRNSIFNYSL